MTENANNPRAEIDAIDDQLLRLLNERAEIALRVGAVKKSGNASLCDPRREREVLARLRRQNTGPLDETSVTGIFQRIIDESLHVQQRAFAKEQPDGETPATGARFAANARAAFLGEVGTFSEEAAVRLLGAECRLRPRPTFEELFAAIDDREADYILAPLENSLVGSVHRCYDLLLENSSLVIVAEIILPISHFLIGCAGASLETIRTVESHPVALAQCARFFAANPHLKREAADDTAGSVRRAVENGDVRRAAIAGRRAAEIYGGVILREHLEDHRENYTRFVLLAPRAPEDAEPPAAAAAAGGEKISLIVRLAHRPGALHDALRPFVRRGIDLLKIESRPIAGRPWQYNFYLDLRAPSSESELSGALDEIREQAEEARFLGRYSTVEVAAEK